MCGFAPKVCRWQNWGGCPAVKRQRPGVAGCSINAELSYYWGRERIVRESWQPLHSPVWYALWDTYDSVTVLHMFRSLLTVHSTPKLSHVIWKLVAKRSPDPKGSEVVASLAIVFRRFWIIPWIAAVAQKDVTTFLWSHDPSICKAEMCTHGERRWLATESHRFSHLLCTRGFCDAALAASLIDVQWRLMLS